MGEMAPAFQFYARDFIVSTADLTDEQVGAYTRLLAFAWDRVGLPLDEARIQRLRPWTDEEWARIWPELKGKWTRRGDRLVNLRQERERDAQKARRDGAVAGGRRGAETRKAQRLKQVDVKSTSSQLAPALQPNGNTASAFALALDQKTTSVAPPPDFDPTTYSHGQVQAGVRGLVGAWNNIVAAAIPSVHVEAGSTSASLSQALARHPDIAWWSDVFKIVLGSDYLTGRDGKHSPMTLWTVASKAEDIKAGRYNDTKKLAVKPALAASATGTPGWVEPWRRKAKDIAAEQGYGGGKI